MVHVLGIGDNTVDIYVDHGLQFPGGNAVNVPVLCKRLGCEAAYLGCIGNDPLGDIIRNSLVSEGIDISRIRVMDSPNSWSRIRHVGADRIFDGNNPSLRDAYALTSADFEWMGEFDLAHSSIYSKLEDELPRIRAAIPILSFDFSSEFDNAYLARVAPYVELAFLSSPDTDSTAVAELARRVAAFGPSLVVVTRGSAGAMALEQGQILHQPTFPADVIDTLGAGDGFIAGLLVARMAGQPLAEQLASGARTAAAVCGERGAFGHETPIRVGQPGLMDPAR
jgi:fructoselysine 6-kinase